MVAEFLARDGVDDPVAPRAERERVPRQTKRKVPRVSRPARDTECELTGEDREWARRIAASLPPPRTSAPLLRPPMCLDWALLATWSFTGADVVLPEAIPATDLHDKDRYL